MRRTLAVLACAVGLLAVAPVTASAAPVRAAPVQTAPTTTLVLPDPTGHKRIGTASMYLVDRSRSDPWVPTQSAREVMVQVWYPARDVRHYPRASWVSPTVAERINPPGSPVILPTTHGHVGAPVDHGRHPVVLYSPGFGVERTAGTALVEELASHGYIVVAIDHTHDAQFVEFPGGRVETRAVPTPTDPADEERIIAKALEVRVADVRFVLDRLTAMTAGHNPDEQRRPLPQGLGDAMDLSRVGMCASGADEAGGQAAPAG